MDEKQVINSGIIEIISILKTKKKIVNQSTVNYREEFTRRNEKRYVADVTHNGLHFFRTFKSDDLNVLHNKVNSIVDELEEKWDKTLEKQQELYDKEMGIFEAEKLTKQAIKELGEVENILSLCINFDNSINFDDLKDKTEFNFPNRDTYLDTKLNEIKEPIKKKYVALPEVPIRESFLTKNTFWDNLIKSKRENKSLNENSAFEQALFDWKTNEARINQLNKNIDDEYTVYSQQYWQEKTKIQEETNKLYLKWEKDKIAFYEKQRLENSKVDELKIAYFNHEPEAVLKYCNLVLTNSKYPNNFPKDFDIDYDSKNKILVIEYSLPSIEDLPTLTEVKYLKDEFKEYYLTEVQTQKMFDSTLYKIALRTIHEIFNSDKANAVDYVSFNGWVSAISKATGRVEDNCILSIQVKKNNFGEIDLNYIDPKTCFKNFKGIGSSKLFGLIPVQPILRINKMDKRFTDHYDVADEIDSSTNLASMDWEDFEHLIREIFASEFSSNGGEVKVTRASRDGGVDAIAFDPDPIRGGKIVIQAKRYTNTVGVSSVRDLYGTVMNEGATKGILVTTADYGSDSYEFAKGKPLTLLNGSELLYLLQKHGHKARIDIKEAKIEMKYK